LAILLLTSETIFYDYLSDLLDLIWFCLATIFRLQIQYLVDSLFGEYVVTSTDAFLKTQASQQGAHTVKGDICIRGATEYPKQELLMLSHQYNPSFLYACRGSPKGELSGTLVRAAGGGRTDVRVPQLPVRAAAGGANTADQRRRPPSYCQPLPRFRRPLH
jgi:hypothetical protein